MAKGCTSVLLVFLMVITLPIWIGLAGGFIGIVGGVLGAVFAVVGAVVGAACNVMSGLLQPAFSLKPVTILLVILVIILLARSGKNAVK